MPELPDVEIFGDLFKQKGVGQIIQSVEIKKPHILKKISKTKFEKELLNHTFLSAQRKGKYLFIQVSGGHTLVLHFGMTGDLQFFKDKPLPKFTCVAWHFKNKTGLAYINIRMIGFVTITNSIESFNKKLGPDALDISKSDFRNLFVRSSIKSILMNQKKIAGIGNIYSDEILFQSRLAPKRQAKTLSTQEIDRLYTAMRKVLKMAIKAHADLSHLPKSWLLHTRHKKGTCPKCAGPLTQLKMGGRSAYHCTYCQL